MKKLLCAALVLQAAAVWAQPNETPADKAATQLARCGDCAQVESVVERTRRIGSLAGDEARRHGDGRMVWVTTVRMADGRLRRFEQDHRPAWGVGAVVHVRGRVLRPA